FADHKQRRTVRSRRARKPGDARDEALVFLVVSPSLLGQTQLLLYPAVRTRHARRFAEQLAAGLVSMVAQKHFSEMNPQPGIHRRSGDGSADRRIPLRAGFDGAGEPNEWRRVMAFEIRGLAECVGREFTVATDAVNDPQRVCEARIGGAPI